MSEHKAGVSWTRAGKSFAYEEYPRNHDVRYPNGCVVAATCAPEYGGDPDRIDPEETFVAALASCHMLTFLAVCSRRGLTVDAYTDEAVGYLEKSPEGRMMIPRVELRPRVVFAPGFDVGPDELAGLHERAHRGCFIANSVKSDVTVQPAPN